jgi:hypothetical protein
MDDGGIAVVSPVTVVSGLSPSHGRKGLQGHHHRTEPGRRNEGHPRRRPGQFTGVSRQDHCDLPAGKGTVAVRVTTTVGTSTKTTADRFTYGR